MKQHAISLRVNPITDGSNKSYPASLVLEDVLITAVHFHCDIDYICSFIYLSKSHIFQLSTGDRRKRHYSTEC